MKEQFADYETSKMLKELGFDEACMGLYGEGGFNCGLIKNVKNSNWQNPVCTAPLWQQIKIWLWEKHKIVFSHRIGGNPHWHCFIAYILKDKEGVFIRVGQELPSPIEAESDAIKEAVQYLYYDHPETKKS